MTTRQDLLTHWDQQLTLADEAELQTATWRERIRQRLYRFLLAMYGGANWSGSPEDAEEVSLHPVALLVSDEAELPDVADIDELQSPGKAPRTRAEILRGLKNVRGLSDELAPPGPLQHGLPADAPMAVAACKKSPRANRVMSLLLKAGFAPVMERRGELWQIFVTSAAAPMAMDLLAQMEPVRRTLTLPRPSFKAEEVQAIHARFFFALMCGVVGGLLTCYVISLLTSHLQDPKASPLPAIDRFAVLLAATGVMDVLCGFFIWLMWRELNAPAENARLSAHGEKPLPASQRD